MPFEVAVSKSVPHGGVTPPVAVVEPLELMPAARMSASRFLFCTGTVAPAAVVASTRPDYLWHTGQKTVVRPPTMIFLSGVAQSRHSSPARP